MMLSTDSHHPARCETRESVTERCVACATPRGPSGMATNLDHELIAHNKESRRICVSKVTLPDAANYLLA